MIPCPVRIPGARRVEAQRLMSVMAIPLAAAVTMATGVAALPGPVDRVAEAGGGVAFVLEFVKVSYLAVAMAHLSGALAERLSGGLPAGVWLAGEEDEAARAPGAGFWDAFPNHLDGSALALAVTVLCWAAG